MNFNILIYGMLCLLATTIPSPALVLPSWMYLLILLQALVFLGAYPVFCFIRWIVKLPKVKMYPVGDDEIPTK